MVVVILCDLPTQDTIMVTWEGLPTQRNTVLLYICGYHQTADKNVYLKEEDDAQLGKLVAKWTVGNNFNEDTKYNKQPFN
jgi:hypothetical protein